MECGDTAKQWEVNGNGVVATEVAQCRLIETNLVPVSWISAYLR